MKRIIRSLWGVSEPSADITPAIDCEPCKVARLAGKDACAVHRTHHDRSHLKGAAPSEVTK